MNVAAFLSLFAKDPILARLFKEPELAALLQRNPTSLVSPAEAAAVLAMCDRIEGMAKDERATLESYEEQLLALSVV